MVFKSIIYFIFRISATSNKIWDSKKLKNFANLFFLLVTLSLEKFDILKDIS